MIRRPLAYARRNALACVALFVALGGTATASHLVVRASDIQRNAVRAQHIKKNAVKQRQVHRANLSRVFGLGVLGTRGGLPPVAGNVAGLALMPAIGSGEAFAMPMPRRAQVRDLYARLEGPGTQVPRPILAQVRRGAVVVLQCQIAQGARTCSSGATRRQFKRGELLSLRLVAPPHPNATGQTMNFQLSYRISP